MVSMCPRCGQLLSTSHYPCKQQIWEELVKYDHLVDSAAECYRKRGYSEGEKIHQGFAMLARSEDCQ